MTQTANLLIAQDLSLSFSHFPLTGREHSILPKHNPLPLCPLLHRGSGRTRQHGPHRVQGEVTPHHSPLVECVHVGQCGHVGSTVHITWQSHVEIKDSFIAYFDCITLFKVPYC